MAEAASPSSHSSFCEEVFSVVAASLWDAFSSRIAQRLQPNEVDRTNILAPGFVPISRNHLLPAFTPEKFRELAQLGSRIQLQQRNCSRFSRDFLRRSTFPSSQRTESRSSGSRSGTQDLIYRSATNRRPSDVIEPYAAKFSSCAARA